jgi:hypothetical protein
MRQLTTIEKSILVLGGVFIAVGGYMIVHPQEGWVFHPGPYKYQGLLGPNKPEYVSKRGSRIYGGIAVVLGGGLSWLAFYRGKK